MSGRDERPGLLKGLPSERMTALEEHLLSEESPLNYVEYTIATSLIEDELSPVYCPTCRWDGGRPNLRGVVGDFVDNTLTYSFGCRRCDRIFRIEVGCQGIRIY